MQFLTAKPQRFHSNLVVKFFYNSTIATDEKSFSAKVCGTSMIISPESLAEDFGLNNSGIIISSYKEELIQEYWTKWKCSDVKSDVKIKFNRGSLELLPIMIMDIMGRIVLQNDSSKLSAKICKPMIAIDDAVEANSASLVFCRLCGNIRQTHLATTNRDRKNVHFEYMVNYLLEKRMSAIDHSVELLSSAFLPSNPQGGLVSKVRPSVRIPGSLSQEYGDKLEKSVPQKQIGAEVTLIKTDVRQARQKQRELRSAQLQLEVKALGLSVPEPKGLTRARSTALTNQIVELVCNQPQP